MSDKVWAPTRFAQLQHQLHRLSLMSPSNRPAPLVSAPCGRLEGQTIRAGNRKTLITSQTQTRKTVRGCVAAVMRNAERSFPRVKSLKYLPMLLVAVCAIRRLQPLQRE